ncbi:hypothetical protein [Streptomyces sp. NPDC048636]|uniref:hypothetical protein n=1 Tax=Streptomyces sp. NPDC048636 TaxID=3155762 RepID=UPI0034142F77
MNIGKTAALVTATAGAVVFVGGHALADPLQNGVTCVGVTGSTECLNFSHVFGDDAAVTQQNHCDNSASSAANVVIAPIKFSPGCSNISAPSTTAAGAL